MLSPVDVENRFSRLTNQLEGVLLKRVQWFRIHSFLDHISDEFKTYDTYCLQITSRLPSFSHPLDVTGIDPQHLVLFRQTLEELEAAVPELSNNDKYKEASESLVLSTAFLYLCLNEFKLVLSTILGGEDQAKRLSPDHKAMDREKINLWLQELGEAPEVIRQPDIVMRLERLRTWWEIVTRQEERTVFIPVYEAGRSQEESPGQLRQLSARVLGPSNKSKDIFHNNYALVGALQGDQGIDQNVAHVVRALINKTHPGLGDKFYEIQFSYHRQHGFHQGKSSELGIGLLGYAAILEKSEVRERQYPQHNVGLSGTLSVDERIGQVDAESIPAKLEATFFSWMDYLVVPESQKIKFERVRELLIERYPNRTLGIIGLKEFHEIRYDRRITRYEKKSYPQYYLNKIWARKFNYSSMLLILALLFIIAALWYGPIDKNPVLGRFEGESLKLINKSGQIIGSIQVGTWPNTYNASNYSDKSFSQVQLHDINGDGINEVFWFQISRPKADSLNSVKAWSVSGDSLIWELPLGFEINFPKKSSIGDQEFFVNEIQVLDGRNKKDLLVINAELQTYFPATILTADIQTGEIEQQYVHAGHLYDIELIDLDKDGTGEIIASGVNNAFWKACLIALDPFNLQGRGPVQGDYVVEGFNRAEELHYVMIPKTIVGQYFDFSQKMARGFKVKKSSGTNLFSVEVRDAYIVDSPQPYPAYVFYHFNQEMEVEGIGTSDTYDITARRLYQEEKIPFEPDYDYFEAFKDSLIYWEDNR